MSGLNQDEWQAIRAKAEEIVRRLESDPTFRAQVEDDPVGTLLAAGLPERVLVDFLREIDVVADVVGYEMCGPGTCLDTCIITAEGDKGLPG